MEMMPLSEIILKKVKFGLTDAIDPVMIQDLKISHTADIVSDQIIGRIRYSLAGQEGREIKFPKDWWEAFKERWFPKWLRRKYPVVYRFYQGITLYPDYVLPEMRKICYVTEWQGTKKEREERS